jgi:hypothetical protein
MSSKGRTGESPYTSTSCKAAKARNFDTRMKPFQSSHGYQISPGRLGQPFDKKSEDGATKSTTVGELGEVENMGPLPQLENQGSDRRRIGVKRKDLAWKVNRRNSMPIGRIVSEIRGSRNGLNLRLADLNNGNRPIPGNPTPAELRGSVSRSAVAR